MRANKDRIIELNFTSRLLLTMERLYVVLHVNHTNGGSMSIATDCGCLRLPKGSHTHAVRTPKLDW